MGELYTIYIQAEGKSPVAVLVRGDFKLKDVQDVYEMSSRHEWREVDHFTCREETLSREKTLDKMGIVEFSLLYIQRPDLSTTGDASSLQSFTYTCIKCRAMVALRRDESIRCRECKGGVVEKPAMNTERRYIAR